MKGLWRWLAGTSGLEQHLEDWTPNRVREKEQQTYRYLGIRPEPIYTWSRKFRKSGKSAKVLAMKRKAG